MATFTFASTTSGNYVADSAAPPNHTLMLNSCVCPVLSPQSTHRSPAVSLSTHTLVWRSSVVYCIQARIAASWKHGTQATAANSTVWHQVPGVERRSARKGGRVCPAHLATRHFPVMTRAKNEIGHGRTKLNQEANAFFLFWTETCPPKYRRSVF